MKETGQIVKKINRAWTLFISSILRYEKSSKGNAQNNNPLIHLKPVYVVATLLAICMLSVSTLQAQISFGIEQTNPFGLTGLTAISTNITPSFVDLDNDGDLDVMGGAANGKFYYYENTGTLIAPAYAAKVENPFSLTATNGYSTVAFTDLDHDGDLDMMSGNGNGMGGASGDLIYYENTGTVAAPVFAAKVTNPFSLKDVTSFSNPAFADLNNDGDEDIMVGGVLGNFYFFENFGGTEFGPSYSDSTSNPYSLTDIGFSSSPTFVDLDGDGDLDMMSGVSGGSNMYFENVGNKYSPTYGAVQVNPFSLTSVGSDSDVTLGDLDGDGDMDMLVGKATGHFSYFENTTPIPEPEIADFGEEQINLFALVELTAGYKVKPQFVDLDDDGDLDIMAGIATGAFKYYENTGGSSTPAYAAAVDNPFGLGDVGSSSTITFGDYFDNDGDLDAIIGTSSGNLLQYKNTGTVDAPVFVSSGFILGTNNYSHSDLVDMDNDGDLDIMTSKSSGIFAYYENTGTPMTPAYSAVVNSPFGLTDIGGYPTPYLTDMDGDGDYDIFTGENSGIFLYIENVGSAVLAVFANPVEMSIELSGFGKSNVTMGDWDDDGDLDLLSGSSSNFAFFENISLVPETPSFDIASFNPFSLADVGSSGAIAFVDLNGDGVLDIMAGSSDGNFDFFANNGSVSSPSFAVATDNPYNLANVGTYSSVTLADVDNDGDYDMISGESAGNFKYFENTGDFENPNFPAVLDNPFGLSDIGTNSAPRFVDLDGDGDFDIMTGASDGNFHYFQNVGSDTLAIYATVQTNPFGLTDVGSTNNFSFADLDKDGDLDLLSGEFSQNFNYFENVGTSAVPSFSAVQIDPFSLSTSKDYNSIAFADLDNDGDVDLMTSEDNGNFYFYYNYPSEISNTWTGATSTAWEVASNWSKGTVPTLNDKVMVDNAANDPVITSDVVLNDFTLAGAGQITISSNSLKVYSDMEMSGDMVIASGASFIPLGFLFGAGFATVHRNTTFGIAEGKYSVIGSPITSGTTDSLGSIVYKYDETIAYNDGGSNGGNRFIEVAAEEFMTVGDAYFSANTGDISFIGTPNNGDISIGLEYNDIADGGASDAGYNLVSNPYTAAISYNNLMAGNADIENTLYFWDDGGSDVAARSNSDYITANSMGAAGGGSSRTANWDGHIRSAQGFFVKATSAGTLNFKPSMMITGNNDGAGFFREEKPTTLRFALSADDMYNDILVGFKSDATLGYDKAYDATKIKGNTRLQLYSRLNEKLLAIQGLPISEEETTVALGFDVSQAGTYTLELMDASQYGFNVYLKDNQLNKLIDLAENNAYTFETSSVVNSERFSLVFSPNAVLAIDDEIISNNMIVFSNAAGLNIRMNAKMKNATVSIYNISGTLVKQISQVEFTGTDWTTSFRQEGLFIITVQSDNQLFIKKFIK